jgi:hypothetical protein
MSSVKFKPRGPTKNRRTFTFLDAGALKQLPAPASLVGHVLAQEALAVLYAAPGGGKSFVALDLACSIATGTYWHGHAVRRGAVVYIAAEGSGGGLGRRIVAWEQAHDCTVHDLWFVLGAVNLLDPTDVDALLLQVEQTLAASPVLVVVDTLARCMIGGDENSSRDMGLAIAAVDHMREVLHASVLLVHHTARGHDLERGSGALRGAADTMLALTKDGEFLTLRCEKQKEGSDAAEIGLCLGLVGPSCVVESAPLHATRPPASVMTALRTLADIAELDGVSYSRWFKASRLDERSFGRARHAALRGGWVRKDDARKRYHLTEAGVAEVGPDARTPQAPADTSKSAGGQGRLRV